MDHFSLSTPPQNFSIGTDNPSPFELAVFNEVVRSLNQRPANPFVEPNASQTIQKQYSIADIPLFSRPGDNEAVIARTVWSVFTHIAKQLNVRDSKQGKLAILLWELNELHCEELQRYGFERHPPSLSEIFADENRVLKANKASGARIQTEMNLADARRRVLGLCAFLGNLAFKSILLHHTAPLIEPCMDLVRLPPREEIRSLLSLPFKEQRLKVRGLSIRDQTELVDWMARVHVSALWIHTRGRHWIGNSWFGHYRPDLTDWLPPTLKYWPYKSRRELWATWKKAYEELADQCGHPNLKGIAEDVGTKMQMISEVAGIISTTHMEMLDMEDAGGMEN